MAALNSISCPAIKFTVICSFLLGPFSATAVARSEVPSPLADVEWQAYGELQLSAYDFPQNYRRDRVNTPQRDKRMALDLSKVSISGSKTVVPGLKVEIEGVVLHTGIAGSNQTNYGGPFNEGAGGGATQGGVLFNKAYVSKEWNGQLTTSVGRVPVAIGQLSSVVSPLDYLATRPFESELSLLPEDWAELGVTAVYTNSNWTSTTEVISGLDSSGFNSYSFIGAGSQGRYGSNKVTEPSIVERFDFEASRELLIGVGYFFGETSQNRPTADMLLKCRKHDENIAPCGYEHAPVILIDAHARYVSDLLTINALALWGSVKKAGAINTDNEANSTNRADLYSPVAAKAFGLGIEIGWRTHLGRLGEGWQPFARFERYNTMFEVAEKKDVNPLFDRTVVTLGCGWRFVSGAYVKVDYSRRRFGSPDLSYESTATLASGLIL